MAFLGWYWDDKWQTYPSKEQSDKLCAVLVKMGATRKENAIDPNFNYVEHFNKLHTNAG